MDFPLVSERFVGDDMLSLSCTLDMKIIRLIHSQFKMCPLYIFQNANKKQSQTVSLSHSHSCHLTLVHCMMKVFRLHTKLTWKLFREGVAQIPSTDHRHFFPPSFFIISIRIFSIGIKKNTMVLWTFGRYVHFHHCPYVGKSIRSTRTICLLLCSFLCWIL